MVDFKAALGSTDTEVVVASPLDIEQAQKRFQPYLEEIERIKTVALDHKIVDEESNVYAIDLTAEIKRLNKNIEAKQEEIVAEPKRFIKAIKNFCKKFTAPLSEAERALKQQIAQYQHKLDLEQRKQEEAIRKANEELQAKLNEEARAAGVEAPQVKPMPLPKKKSIARTGTGASAYTRKNWKAEIIDPALVPREYCEPSMKLINHAVKMGVREIPGVRIWQDVQAVVRT